MTCQRKFFVNESCPSKYSRSWPRQVRCLMNPCKCELTMFVAPLTWTMQFRIRKRLLQCYEARCVNLGHTELHIVRDKQPSIVWFEYVSINTIETNLEFKPCFTSAVMLRRFQCMMGIINHFCLSDSQIQSGSKCLKVSVLSGYSPRHTVAHGKNRELGFWSETQLAAIICVIWCRQVKYAGTLIRMVAALKVWKEWNDEIHPSFKHASSRMMKNIPPTSNDPEVEMEIP